MVDGEMEKKTHHPNKQKQREQHLPIIAVREQWREKFVINLKPSGYQDLLASLRYGVLPMYII